jgi:hypothetical protein
MQYDAHVSREAGSPLNSILSWQRARLEAQVAAHAQRTEADVAAAASDEARQAVEDDAYEVNLDEDFVTALEYGMPPTAGMVSTHNSWHRQLTSFPQRSSKQRSVQDALVALPSHFRKLALGKQSWCQLDSY